MSEAPTGAGENRRTLVLNVPEEKIQAVLAAAGIEQSDEDVSGFAAAPVIDVTGTGCFTLASGGSPTGGRGDIQCGDDDTPY